MTFQPRILFYLPDDNWRSLQRYLAIAHQLAQDLPDVQQKLLVKTLPKVNLPPGVEVVGIPQRERGAAQEEGVSPGKMRRRREEYILNVIFQFDPHLVLVDREASGLNGEILPALRFLKAWSPQTKIVYGMPDVDAFPQSIKISWQVNGIYSLLDEFYDRILFYGQRDLFDPIMAYQMPVSTAVKVVECGYVNYLSNGSESSAVVRQPDNKISILVIVDSEEAIENCTQFFNRSKVEISHHPPAHLSLLIDTKLTIQQIRDFLTDMERWPIDVVNFDLSLCQQYIDSADLVVCNASYASVCNVIGRNKRTLYLIGKHTPPDHLMRAHALFRAGLAQIYDLSVNSSFSLTKELNSLDTTKTMLPSSVLHLNGARLASQTIASMIMG